jgi:ABC-2 type transport system permease protein
LPPDLRSRREDRLSLCLLSLGVATCVRDRAADIGIVLALLYLFPIFGPILGSDLGRHAQQIGP